MMPTGSKNCLLDTSVVIEAFKTTNVLSELSKFETVYVSNIVLGELYYGAYNSENSLKHERQIADFISLCSILLCDEQTSVYYGRVNSRLKKSGTPIPENDIWIAALAIQHDLRLFTNDNHFNYVDGLTVMGF